MPVPELALRSAVKPSGAGHRVQLALKRAFDFLAALLLLFILAPLLGGTAILVIFHDGGPAVVRHNRMGLGGRIFGCLKFRSMVPNAQAVLEEYLARNPEAREEWKAKRDLIHDPRMTPLGRFLRKTRLDELPQLVNILLGQMSLVGPRPIVPDEAARDQDQLSAYTAVRPGVTGLWQVSGRRDCTHPERHELDVQYARGWNLLLDLAILVRTIPAVLAERGSR